MTSCRQAFNLVAICVWWALSVAGVFAQDRETIIAKAKEEKTLVYYSTTDIRDGTAVVHAFQKKYPFIEPKLFRLGSTQVVVKVLQKHRGGAHLFDVLSASSFQFYEIFKEDLFQKAKDEQNYNTTMEVKLTSGRIIKGFQQYPPGSPLNPVSRDELRRKFKKLASAGLPANRLDEVIQTVDQLEKLDDASKLVPLLSVK